MDKKSWYDIHREKLDIDTPFDVIIRFPTQKDKEEFCSWMSEQGEQTWWIWEENYSDNLLEFLYHDENGEWQTDWIKAVRTKDK